MSLRFKCPEKLCRQNLHYEDFMAHTHSLPKNNLYDDSTDFRREYELSLVEAIRGEMSSRGLIAKKRSDSSEAEQKPKPDKKSFSERLRELANEQEDQEAKEIALKNEEVGNLRNLVSFQEKRINELMSDASDHAKIAISLANENESLKTELENAQDEISNLQNMKEKYNEMSNMFGRFNIEWMESKGKLSRFQFW